MNKLQKVIGIFGLVLFTMSSFADEEKHVSVFVKKLDHNDSKVEFKINGDVDAFKLPELEDGEERTFTTDSGAELTVSKVAGDLKIVTEDGEEILIPSPDKNHLVAKVKAFTDGENLHIDDSIRIMASDLTDDQKETIKASIAAAGIVKPVKFVENHRMFFFSEDDENRIIDIDQEINIKSDGKRVHRIKIEKDHN